MKEIPKGIYPVITNEFCNGKSTEEVLSAVARGGAKMVQIREKDLSTGDFVDLCRKCRKITHEYEMLMIVNDRVDIALAVGADGVHLGQDDMSLKDAKQIAPDLIYGISTHNLDEAVLAQIEGADYINIGPVYPTKTKKVGYPAVGTKELAHILEDINIPFTVMGGIKEHHISELKTIGCERIAMVTAITQAADIAKEVSRFNQMIREG